MKKKITRVAVLCALIAAVFALSACSANAGFIVPVGMDELDAFDITAFEDAGLSVHGAYGAQGSAFDYRWTEPPANVRVWADLYRDGTIISDPVEIEMNDLKSTDGTIALFSEELNDETQEFALVVTNGEGSGARVEVKTGELELGAAMAPSSRTTLQDAQATETGMTNVLLVMHDGPNLDTAMENSLDDTEQLIASSTYTLVLNCVFD